MGSSSCISQPVLQCEQVVQPTRCCIVGKDGTRRCCVIGEHEASTITNDLDTLAEKADSRYDPGNGELVVRDEEPLQFSPRLSESDEDEASPHIVFVPYFATVGQQNRQLEATGAGSIVTAAEQLSWKKLEAVERNDEESTGFQEVSNPGEDSPRVFVAPQAARGAPSRRTGRTESFLYSVVLSKRCDDDELGLVFEQQSSSEGLHILRIHDGLVKAQNATADFTQQVVPGDILMQVNEAAIASQAELLRIWASSQDLRMTLQRPDEIHVRVRAPIDGEWHTVDGGGLVAKTTIEDLGLVLSDTDMPVWHICEVKSGLVTNALRSAPDIQVLPGDRVIEVSGVRDDAEAMRRVLTELPLELVILRPSEDVD